MFTPRKLGSVKWFKFAFSAINSGFGRYLFQMIVLLKPDYNFGNNFELSSVIVNLEFWSATLVLIITQSADQVKISSTSQLIKSILRVLQTLLKYFNGTIISILFSSLSLLIWPVIFVLNFNES